MRITIAALAIATLLVSIAGAQSRATKVRDVPRSISGEVEIDCGQDVCRVTVYVVNAGTAPFEFLTGSQGGYGHWTDEPDPPDSRPIGTGITVVPTLEFELADGQTFIVTAPRMTNSVTRRGMEAATFSVSGNEHKMYYSFLAPRTHVTRRFVRGEIRLADGRRIPITRTFSPNGPWSRSN